MEEKLRFVFEYERDVQTISELCGQFGISRETGYVWLRRYRRYGPEGLLELNRAPVRHPNQTAAAIEEAVLELRQAHMTWGPRKLKRVLDRDQPGRRWPATSTMGEIVKRAGLVVARKKRRRTEPYTEPLGHAVGPNRVWCADFKGLVPIGRRGAHRSVDHQRCLQPLPAALAGGREDRHRAGARHQKPRSLPLEKAGCFSLRGVVG